MGISLLWRETSFLQLCESATMVSASIMRAMSEQVIERDSIPKSYAPSEIEGGIIAKWDQANIGHEIAKLVETTAGVQWQTA